MRVHLWDLKLCYPTLFPSTSVPSRVTWFQGTCCPKHRLLQPSVSLISPCLLICTWLFLYYPVWTSRPLPIPLYPQHSYVCHWWILPHSFIVSIVIEASAQVSLLPCLYSVFLTISYRGNFKHLPLSWATSLLWLLSFYSLLHLNSLEDLILLILLFEIHICWLLWYLLALLLLLWMILLSFLLVH